MNGSKLKISFDFDGTLTLLSIQNLAKFLIDSGADVWILTARSSDNVVCDKNNIKFYTNVNSDIRYIANRVGIPYDKIIYTNGFLKKDTYFKEKFDLHFDDSYDEVEQINKYGGCAMLVDMRIAALMMDMDLMKIV